MGIECQSFLQLTCEDKKTMVVDRNERVLEMVEEALREDPEVSNDELQQRASEIDPRIGELSPRSFNARYPLQVKRKLAAQEDEESKSSTGRAGLREATREELLNFARAVVGAEDRSRVIDVVEKVDEYVDNVMERA